MGEFQPYIWERDHVYLTRSMNVASGTFAIGDIMSPFTYPEVPVVNTIQTLRDYARYNVIRGLCEFPSLRNSKFAVTHILQFSSTRIRYDGRIDFTDYQDPDVFTTPIVTTLFQGSCQTPSALINGASVTVSYSRNVNFYDKPEALYIAKVLADNPWQTQTLIASVYHDPDSDRDDDVFTTNTVQSYVRSTHWFPGLLPTPEFDYKFTDKLTELQIFKAVDDNTTPIVTLICENPIWMLLNASRFIKYYVGKQCLF